MHFLDLVLEWRTPNKYFGSHTILYGSGQCSYHIKADTSSKVEPQMRRMDHPTPSVNTSGNIFPNICINDTSLVSPWTARTIHRLKA